MKLPRPRSDAECAAYPLPPGCFVDDRVLHTPALKLTCTALVTAICLMCREESEEDDTLPRKFHLLSTSLIRAHFSDVPDLPLPPDFSVHQESLLGPRRLKLDKRDLLNALCLMSPRFAKFLGEIRQRRFEKFDAPDSSN